MKWRGETSASKSKLWTSCANSSIGVGVGVGVGGRAARFSPERGETRHDVCGPPSLLSFPDGIFQK